MSKKIFAIVSLFLLIFLVESCENVENASQVVPSDLQENKTNENMIRPDAHNILRYITEEELITLEEKLPNHIKNQGFYDYAINDDSTVTIIVLFQGVSFEEAKAIANKYGAITDDFFGFNQLTIKIPQENFWKLARESNVKRIVEGNPPIEFD